MKIHEMFPYLCVSDANEAIDFYGKVFGATPVTIHLHVDDADELTRCLRSPERTCRAVYTPSRTGTRRRNVP